MSSKTVNFTLNGNASGSAVTDASGIAAVNLTGVTSVNAGTYPNGVAASFAGDGSLAPASGMADLSVDQASQTITFAALTDKTFGDSDFAVSASADSGLTVTFTVGATDNCTISIAMVRLTGAGSCTVTAHQAGNTNYKAASNVARTFSIHKATQTITFNPLANVKLSQSPVTVSATASVLPVTFTTTTPPVCTPGGTNGATITLLATGTCTVVAHQTGNTDYSAAVDVPQSFTVGNGKADQTITFTALANKTLAQSPVTVSATASSGLVVTFTTTTTAVCTAGGKSGATISLIATGTCTVQAAQAGGASYNPAPSVTQSFTVTKSDQSITFASLATKQLNQSPVTVSATASSGLAVTYTTTTPAKCTASGKNGATIKLVAVGPCTVKADQIGNAAYNAAPPVIQSFTVMP